MFRRGSSPCKSNLLAKLMTELVLTPIQDGGEYMELYLNDKLVCSSNATYGGGSGTMKADGKEWTTISKMSECEDTIKVKKGDKINMKSRYNTLKHPL